MNYEENSYTFRDVEAALMNSDGEPRGEVTIALRAVVRFARLEFDASDLDLASLLDEAIKAENAGG